MTGLRSRAETSRDHEAIAQVTTAAFGKPSEARMIEAIRRTDGFVPELSLGHLGYYARFGFRRASTLGITTPDPEIRDEVFMAIPLRAYDPALRGRVTFPPAFSA